MESRAKFLGHPLHQMLVAFPVGLLGTAVVFDIIHLATGRPLMASIAHYLILSGLIAGVIAAPFGTIDWLAIPRGTRAWAVGAMHGLGNVGVLLLFIVSWWLRHDQIESPPALAYLACFAGGALALVTAWLGGELVDRLGMGVSDNANLDASSSLRGDAGPRHRYP